MILVVNKGAYISNTIFRMTQNRQLAAIMFTDIVGYTALMGKDEDKAFSLLDKNREIQRPLIEKYNGKWLKELGDGIMARFHSAYDAVKCAIAIQKAVKQNFDGQLRIGIHLGDITNENDDVFGDGVNVASRIQGIADPGGIYITESVENAVRNRPDIKTKYLGEANLKNVDYPVNVYAIQGEEFPVPVFEKRPVKKTKIIFFLVSLVMLIISGWFIASKISGTRKANNRIRSLAVLPFKNLTGSDDQEYIVAGIHDALISELSHINSLRVISRTSATKYTNTDKPLSEIAKELDVDAIIETSILKADDSIRLNVQLIRLSPKEDHIWAGFFDDNIKGVLSMISSVTQEIATKIKIVLSSEEKELIAGKGTVDPGIYKLYLQGKFQLDKHTQDGYQKGFAYLNQVIEKDPMNAKALAAMAIGYSDLAHLPAPPQDAFPRAKVLAKRALELDSNLVESNVAMAFVNLYYDWDYRTAEKYFLKALALDSNFAPANAHYGWMLDLLGNKTKAEKYMRLACVQDPLVPIYRVWLASWYWGEKRYDDAEREAKRVLSIEPDHPMATWIIGGIDADKGKYDEAILLHKKITGTFSQFYWALGKTYALAGLRKEAITFLDKMEQSAENAIGFASIYSAMGDMDNAVKWAQVVRDTRHPFTAWLGRAYFAEQLNNDPRFQKIMQPITDSISAYKSVSFQSTAVK